MEDIIYVRCDVCSTVYNQELGKCPNCGQKPSLDENNNNEPIFNIND